MSATAPAYPSFAVDDRALTDAVDALITLVDVDATSGREAAITDAAEALCARLDLPVTRMSVAPGRDNLLVGDPAPRVVLCTHLDTVPPHRPAARDASHVHGRGAADAKGIAVAMLYALVALREAGLARGVGAWLVVGEETDHAGARAAAASPLRPDVIILGEPCGTRPAFGQKGLLKLHLRAWGAAGHSAYPDTGVSAVHRLLDALHALTSEPLPADEALGETTVNVGRVEGGLAANVIAPAAEALVLIRCAAPVDAILAEIETRLPDGVSYEETGRAEPLEFASDAERLGGPPGPAVPFNTDAHTLAPLGAELILMGPGDMRCAHADGERLSIEALRAGIQAYAELVVRLR